MLETANMIEGQVKKKKEWTGWCEVGTTSSTDDLLSNMEKFWCLQAGANVDAEKSKWTNRGLIFSGKPWIALICYDWLWKRANTTEV